jgi:hypothetical protein
MSMANKPAKWERLKDSPMTSILKVQGVKVARVKRIERGAWEGSVHIGGKIINCWAGTEKSARQGCVNMLYTYALGKGEAKQ